MSQTCLRGMSFKEVILFPGKIERSTQLEVPSDSQPVRRMLEGYEDSILCLKCGRVEQGLRAQGRPRLGDLVSMDTLRALNYHLPLRRRPSWSCRSRRWRKRSATSGR